MKDSPNKQFQPTEFALRANLRLNCGVRLAIMRATLIVFSSCAQLAALESVLGQSRLKEHDLGTARASGIIRRESIWMRDWVLSAEPPTSPLSEVLTWYEPRRLELLALDPEVFVKLDAVADEDGFSVPIDLAEQLFLQRVYLTVDRRPLARNAPE